MYIRTLLFRICNCTVLYCITEIPRYDADTVAKNKVLHTYAQQPYLYLTMYNHTSLSRICDCIVLYCTIYTPRHDK